jgi:hypothetical protein
VHEEVKITHAVPAVLVVLKVDPKPSTSLAIQDVKCARPSVPSDDEKYQNCRWKLYPSNRLRLVGRFGEGNHRFFRAAGRFHFQNWYRSHRAKHGFSSFLEVLHSPG